MGDKHIARLEPVGIELEVDEDETILDAAFRQGIMLMHGCKEGQCAACKSFLLDGEVDLDRYSTFALPDFEESEGYTLLCRAHALSDVEIELINYDEEIIRSGVPIVTATAEVEAVEALTHDIRRLVLKLPDPLVFNAGQYMDIAIPGVEGKHRSFSMANTPGQPDRLEFMIKLYEGGHFSGLLAESANGNGIRVGDALTCTGPYGVFTLRDSSPRRLVFIAGGAGMAPIVSLLRSMEEKGSARPATFYYGARTADDLFALEELERLVGVLPDLRFVPALSDSAEGWEGEAGLITDVVDRMEDDLTEVDAYLCGPPPMVDAAIALLERRGCPEARIYFDKFTTTAD
jgi:propane monooxygenase reductase component